MPRGQRDVEAARLDCVTDGSKEQGHPHTGQETGVRKRGVDRKPLNQQKMHAGTPDGRPAINRQGVCM